MKNVLIFAAGAAVGSVVTWKLIEKKYRDLADEEIASVVGTFTNRKEMNIKTKEQEEIERDNAIVEETIDYNKKVKDLEYAKKEADNIKQHIVEEDDANDVIAIITGEEFGAEEDYDTKSYMYWNDGVVTDEYDMVVDEPRKILGDAISCFENNEECECVYVRNGKLKCDYEILRSEKDFNE